MDDGTVEGTGGTKGSNLPIKLTVADGAGSVLTIPDLYALVSNKDATTQNAVFTPLDCGDGTNKFTFDNGLYSCNWKTPKQTGLYYIRILAGHPAGEPNRLMTDPDNPHCVEQLELTDDCPSLATYDPNNPNENIDYVVSMTANIIDKGNGGGNPNK
jgi:hypothetical protein